MLDKAKDDYYNETIKPSGNWGDGMRLSKLPSNVKWERLKNKVEELQNEINSRTSDEVQEVITKY